MATTAAATCFRIQRTAGGRAQPGRTARRKRAAFTEVLAPDCGGLLVSDRSSVYRRVPPQRRQLCWDHLRRDRAGCLTRKATARRWAQALLDQVDASVTHRRWERAAQIDLVQLQVLTAPPHPSFHLAERIHPRNLR